MKVLKQKKKKDEKNTLKLYEVFSVVLNKQQISLFEFEKENINNPYFQRQFSSSLDIITKIN